MDDADNFESEGTGNMVDKQAYLEVYCSGVAEDHGGDGGDGKGD